MIRFLIGKIILPEAWERDRMEGSPKMLPQSKREVKVAYMAMGMEKKFVPVGQSD